MNLTYDREITISQAGTRFATLWQPHILTVGEFYDRLKTPARGTETYVEYCALPVSEQGRLKDVGGFVGGTLKDGRRSAHNVLGRDLITLDLDTIPAYEARKVISRLLIMGFSFCAYSTRKHCPTRPRLRVIVPTDRTMTPDEYEPIARKVASWIGIEMADPTTFQAVRLMYWPSCSRDGEYIFEYQDGPLLEADKVLSSYEDWTSFESWPQVPGVHTCQALAVQQAAPESKPGIVGAFCREYDIPAAIDKFLPNVYEDCENGRYTYMEGSTAGGAVLYEHGQFLYSHHATDPCSGRLVNSFDLVRLHKFGHMDADCDERLSATALPSFKAMCELASADDAVGARLSREQYEEAQKDIQAMAQAAAQDGAKSKEGGVDFPEEGGVETQGEEPDMSWVQELQRSDKTGQVSPTMQNIRIILEKDPALKGAFAMNKFAGRFEILKAVPWSPEEGRRYWTDGDTSGLYYYLETAWKITKRSNIDAALDVFAILHSFNEVEDYLKGLEWDGTERLDTLLIDLLGAEDCAYVRAVTRKAFTAAVARAMHPGCKFDQMLIMCGPQGIGKSTLLDKMSRGWFNDSIRTFEGKDASELLQGVWIVEIAELDAFNKSDVSRIKQFLSLRVDRYRAAYGHHVKDQPRCCVLFGTCNEDEILRDPTGNRRFWPVDVGVQDVRAHVWDALTDDVVDQLWAEARTRYEAGECLYLTGALAEDAKERQEEHVTSSGREGMIADFLSQPVPADWQSWDLDRRRLWWSNGAQDLHTSEGGSSSGAAGLVERDRVCAMEIWCELLGGSPINLRAQDRKEINAALSSMPGWTKSRRALWFGPYKTSRGYIKK